MMMYVIDVEIKMEETEDTKADIQASVFVGSTDSKIEDYLAIDFVGTFSHCK